MRYRPFFDSLQSRLHFTSGFETQRLLLKWLYLSTLIGIVAGCSAVIFTYAIDLITHLSLGEVAHYLPPSPLGEGNRGVMSMERPWLIPLIVAAGGLLSGLIVFLLAPEAEGHGTDAAIRAFHFERGRIRARIPPIKLIASAITIGTGGSAGREGPTAQISAGFGSLLSNWLNLPAEDRRTAAAVGIGAGIGAIFRAPLGGALMAAEILYIHDIEVEVIIPALMASIVGYSIYGAIEGYIPIFGNQAGFAFTHPVQLVYYAIIGMISALGGLLYRTCFYRVSNFSKRIALPAWSKPAIGGLVVGVIGLLIPGALHTGYGWVQVVMSPKIFSVPLWMILLLPFAKIIATSFSIGSGGSGGIFGPGMVIGGFFGASFWRLFHDVLPQMPVSPAPFVIIGMMALFGGIAHAPLAVMIMVAEMTGNLSLLAPAMVAVAVSTAIVGDHTIYENQLRTRSDSPAHRLRMSFPLLSALSVADAVVPPDPQLTYTNETMNVRSEEISETDDSIITNPAGEVVGIVRHENLLGIDSDTKLESLITPAALVLAPSDSLDIALDKLTSRGLTWAPVCKDKMLLGRIRLRDIMKVYKENLQRGVRRISGLNEDSVLLELQLPEEAEIIGKSLREAKLPANTLVISVSRDGRTFFPNADSRILAGDLLVVVTNRENEPVIRELFDAKDATG